MKPTHRLSTQRKLVLGALSFLSLATIATAESYADANPFERSAFGNDWGILSNEIFFGGANNIFGLSPASRTLLLSMASESKKSENAIVSEANSDEDLFSFATAGVSPFSYSASGISAPNAIAAVIEWANVGNQWSVGTNWVGGNPPANSTVTDIAAFGSTGSGPVNPTVDGVRSINGVQFLSGAFSYTVTGSALIVGSSGISNASTNMQTFSNEVRTSTSQTWTTSSATGQTVFNGTVDINQNAATARTLTIDGPGFTTFNGTIQNSAAGSTGNLTKNGTGVLLLTGANTYNGATTINGGTLNAAATDALGGTSNVAMNGGGTLLFSGSGTTDRVNDTATMTFNGGTFNTAGLSEHGANANDAGMGAVTLQSSSILNLANGSSIIAFANSSLATWAPGQTLSIYNWSGSPLVGDGTDQVYFGNNASGLTPTQLSQISFYSDSGTTLLGTGVWAMDMDGEVVPLPEPSTWVGAALALFAVGFTQRRKLRSLLAHRA